MVKYSQEGLGTATSGGNFREIPKWINMAYPLNIPYKEVFNAEDYINLSRDEVLKSVVQLIKEKMAPTYIYFLAKRTTAIYDISNFYNISGEEVRPTAYWVFVVTDTPKEKLAKHIVDRVEKDKEAISLCLCVATQKRIQKQLWKANRFITNVLKNGHLLYKSKYAMEFTAIKSGFLASNDNEVGKVFGSRYQHASLLLEAAKAASDNQIVALVSIAMAIEQICLGLLYAVWQHVPKQCSLSHLVKLCNLFWPKIMDYYPQETQQDLFLFQLLKKTNRQMSKIKRETQIDQVDLEILLSRTGEFLEESRDFVEELS